MAELGLESKYPNLPNIIFLNTKPPFWQQLFHSFFTSHPYPFLWESLEEWGPLLRGYSANCRNPNAYHVKFLWSIAAAHPPLTQTSLPLLSWNTHTSVIADVLGSNGTSRGNSGRTWIPDIPSICIPRWLQVENFAHTQTAGIPAHFLLSKLLPKLLQGPNLLFRSKESLREENSLLVIPHSLSFI